MNNQALTPPLQAIANKFKNNQKCRFTDIDQLHKTVSSKPAMLQQLDTKAQKSMSDYKHCCPNIDKIRRSSLSGMKLPQFITAVNFILANLQENEFSLLNASLPSGSIKANWNKISQALDDVQKNRKLDSQKIKLLLEFYDATKSKGMDWGNLKSKFETFSKYNQMLKKFENDNTSLTSKEI
ncbi:MAG: hypothetical protein K0U45_04350, partial [Alphaproteobacteria bacterium]|nr:hypothetical protein [Alphaproteobacteria bacterium]